MEKMKLTSWRVRVNVLCTVYLIEVTKNCDDSLPLTLSGNAFTPGTFKAICKCGVEGNVWSAQEVGLDPSDPNFQKRVEEILSSFTSLTYFVVTVTQGQMIMEERKRTRVNVQFHTVAECKTCSTKISGSECSQADMNAFYTQHKGHDLQMHTVVDTNDRRIVKAVEQQLVNRKG